MKPMLIEGGLYSDVRGSLFYNNDFDATEIKRIYFIENESVDFIRAWQGHKIEQRWFAACSGSFKIRLIEVDNWENPTKSLEPYIFILKAEKLNILHIPQGYISSIQSLEVGSKLLVIADYKLDEIKDEYRYDVDYFEIKNIGLEKQ